MRASVNRPANVLRMIFGMSGCRINGLCTPITALLRTIQSPPNVRSCSRLSQRPAAIQGVFNGGSDVLVGVIGHWIPFPLAFSMQHQF
jgi:hypothetical protein